MVRVTFAQSIQRHLPVPDADVTGSTVRDVLDAVFAQHKGLRGYVLDDQGSVREHVAVFVDGKQIEDPSTLSDRVAETTRIHVIQALSGG